MLRIISKDFKRRAYPARGRVVHGLSLLEDVVYIGLAILLGLSALTLLGIGFRLFVGAVVGHSLGGQFIALLDHTLLVLLVVELLYTVQVSFREHGLVAEPFIVVALIAVIRRVLVLTAEIPQLPQADERVFRHAMTELVVLTVMMITLVGSLLLLHKQTKQTVIGDDPTLNELVPQTAPE